MSIQCNSIDVSDYCTQITSNPDISGIGVRLALYVQALLSMSISSFLWDNEKAFRDTCRNSYVVSGSLTIATLIAWATDELSLFDALITSMLTTLMTTFVAVNGTYIHSLGLSINLACLIFTSFWCYWGLQVWANVSTFGLPLGAQNCTANEDTRFVVLGHSVHATNGRLRAFAMFIFALGVVSALHALWVTVSWVLRYKYDGPQESKRDAAEQLARRQRLRQERGRGSQHVVRFGGLVGLIYLIVTTEQMVAWNPDVSQALRDWSFGQTLALIMLAQQIFDCASYIEETRRVRRKQAQHASNQSRV
ncbi:transmembrane protein [Ceratobasidium sp. AG-Ba]|nr:transmembrane protein [Ceratobasidium sp. AG-Ba]QRW04241.1 transmembrane protein [Ceratobasidium sp. AG-Ba]